MSSVVVPWSTFLGELYRTMSETLVPPSSTTGLVTAVRGTVLDAHFESGAPHDRMQNCNVVHRQTERLLHSCIRTWAIDGSRDCHRFDARLATWLSGAM